MYHFRKKQDATVRPYSPGRSLCVPELRATAVIEFLQDHALPELTIQVDTEIPSEGCRITIPEIGAITIEASTPNGAFYGLNTLQRLRNDDGTYLCGVLEDAPELAFRGYHFTLGGGLCPTYHRMRELIKLLATWKYNKLVIEYDDRFPLLCHPELVHPQTWSRSELKSLIELAKDYFIEVVPLLDSLGHVSHYLSHPKYVHLAEQAGDAHEMCSQNPAALKLMEEIWEEVLAFHPDTKYAHITGDEVFLVNHFCDQCRPYAESGRLGELFCDYYTKLSRFIIAHGKTPIIWGDMLLKYPQALDGFPRDVMICDWQYSCDDSPRWNFNALKQLNPCGVDCTENDKLFAPAADEQKDGSCRAFPSVDFFREQGFKVIGAGSGSIGTFKQTGVGEYLLPRQTLCVRNQQAMISSLQRNHSFGYLHTIWGNTGGVEYCMYSAFAGAEYAWRATPIRNDDILADFNRYWQYPDAENLIPLTDDLWRFMHGEIPTFKYTSQMFFPVSKLPFSNLVRANLELGHIDSELREIAVAKITCRKEIGFKQLNLKPIANAVLSKVLGSEQQPFTLSAGHYRQGELDFEIDPQYVLCLQYGKSTGETISTLPLSGKYTELELVLAGTFVGAGLPMLAVILRYQDNTEARIEMNGVDDIQDWYGLPIFSKHSIPLIAGRAIGDATGRIGLTCVRNPHPQKELVAIEFEFIAKNTRSKIVIAGLGCSDAPEIVKPVIDIEAFRRRLNENFQRQREILAPYLIEGDFEQCLKERIVDSRMKLMEQAFK